MADGKRPFAFTFTQEHADSYVVPASARSGPAHPLSEDEYFEEILKSVNYDVRADIDISDPVKMARFFHYWAKRRIERGEA